MLWDTEQALSLYPLKENTCPFIARLNFDSNNNVAKYEACIMGLQAAMAKKVKNLKVYGDSALVIYQLRGDWLTRDSKMILYHKRAMEMVEEHTSWVTDHTRIEKIDGDSIYFCRHPSRAGNRYDK